MDQQHKGFAQQEPSSRQRDPEEEHQPTSSRRMRGLLLEAVAQMRSSFNSRRKRQRTDLPGMR